MKVFKKILAIILIILLINIIPIITNISTLEASDTVQLSLVQQPYIDVVLSKAKTSTDLANFKTDLLDALKERGVDTSKVNVSSVETVSISSKNAPASEIFNSWQKYPLIQDSKFDAQWKLGTDEIYTTANVHWTGFWNTNAVNQTDYTIEFQSMTTTHLDPWGFTFRMTSPSTDRYSFYAIEWSPANQIFTLAKINSWKPSSSDPTHGGPLYHGIISAADGYYSKTSTYYANAYGGALADCNGKVLKRVNYSVEYNKWYNTKIVANGNRIQVYIDGSLVIDYTDNNNPLLEGAYGPYTASQYNTHYRQVSISSDNIKKLEEVLREPDWREDSIKVLTNVGDEINEQLDNPTSLGELLTRMINDEIHYVGWGKDVNKTQSLNFIAANNNNGTFINNTNYQNSINKTAEYIKSLIESKQSSNYILLNENTLLSADDSIMTNTANSEYPYGKWKILHDCEYFENNIGQLAQSGKYMSDMLTSLNKTGKYEILYEDRNIQPTYIYVHRKPVAEIEVERSGDTVTLTSLGYDLDNYSNNRGIEEEEWKWRKVGETTWNDGKLTDISDGTDFLVQLRVKDFQGVWSAPESKYITKQNTKPIASFKIKNRTCSIYEQVSVVDGSYDPYGGKITARKWTVYKENTKIYEGSIPLGNYKSYGIGNYKMSLVVTNDRNMTSEVFTRNYTIIPDDEAPEFTATPISCDWQKSVTVNIIFKDRLGSGFKSYQYAITDSQEEPTSWSTPSNNIVDNIKITQDGIQYLHIKATDNAGNVSEDRMVGPYKIDGTPPEAVVYHEPVDWVIDYVTIKWNFSDSKSGIDYVILPDRNITHNIGGEYVVSENGEYTFTAYDKVGNETTVTETITNIDNIKPEGVLSLSETELTDQPVQILWEAVDYQSGFNKIILPDASISNDSKGSFPITQMGVYTFIIYDKVGNDREISIEINNVDMGKPTLIVTQEKTRWTNEDIELHWKASDEQSGLKEVVLPNSERTQKEEGDHTVTQNGIYTFIAYDKIGNGILVEHEVTNIDKTGPFLKLKSEPADDGSVNIIWEMEDTQSGIKNILLPDERTSTKTTGSFKVKENGTYTFIAYDKVGNDTIMELEVDLIDKEGVKFTLYKEKVDENYTRIYWEIIEGKEDFKHILLPDNTYSEETKGYFIVEKEGTYTFLAYDKTGNETKQSINIP